MSFFKGSAKHPVQMRTPEQYDADCKSTYEAALKLYTEGVLLCAENDTHDEVGWGKMMEAKGRIKELAEENTPYEPAVKWMEKFYKALHKTNEKQGIDVYTIFWETSAPAKTSTAPTATKK